MDVDPAVPRARRRAPLAKLVTGGVGIAVAGLVAFACAPVDDSSMGGQAESAVSTSVPERPQDTASTTVAERNTVPKKPDQGCPYPPDLSEVEVDRATEGLGVDPTWAGEVSLEEAAEGARDSELRLQALRDAGALSATEWQWEFGEYEFVFLREFEFPDAAAATDYAVTDALVACQYSPENFFVPDFGELMGVVQTWAEGPPGYWSGIRMGSTYVRAYGRGPDPGLAMQRLALALKAGTDPSVG